MKFHRNPTEDAASAALHMVRHDVHIRRSTYIIS